MHEFLGNLSILSMASFTIGWKFEELSSEFIRLSAVFSAFF